MTEHRCSAIAPGQPSDPALFAPLTIPTRSKDPSRSPDLGLVQAVRHLPGAVRAVAGNRRAAWMTCTTAYQCAALAA